MTHENRTEKFFAHGIENYGTFHGNYLNFGLWENGITDYVQAAENLLLRVANKINLNKESVLLDVGCGMGSQDLFFIKIFQCDKIEALDLTRKHIELAKNRNTDKNINYIVGNACKLPFNDNMFTHVTGIEAPVNFNTREKFFKEAYRVLRSNGMLGISDFNLAREPENAFEKLIINFCVWMWHIPKDNKDTFETYKLKLEKSGFVDVNIEVVSEKVHPGYFKEQIKKETRTQMYKIRGHFVARVGLFIDFVTYMLYKMNLIGYILVSARKK